MVWGSKLFKFKTRTMIIYIPKRISEYKYEFEKTDCDNDFQHAVMVTTHRTILLNEAKKFEDTFINTNSFKHLSEFQKSELNEVLEHLYKCANDMLLQEWVQEDSKYHIV